MKEKRLKVKDTIVVLHYTKESTNSLKLPEVRFRMASASAATLPRRQQHTFEILRQNFHPRCMNSSNIE